MTYALAALAGYLLGSIPVALIVARRHGIDLRRSGDGNPGAWNAMDQLGTRAALPVFAGDALKGTAAGLAGLAIAGHPAGTYAGVGAAMIGHAFPVFAGFRGGKAVMTFAGGVFVVSLPAAALALAACMVVSLAARSFAWGARVGVFGFPVVQLVFDPPARVAATGVLMTIIGLLFLTRRSAPASAGSGEETTA